MKQAKEQEKEEEQQQQQPKAEEQDTNTSVVVVDNTTIPTGGSTTTTITNDVDPMPLFVVELKVRFISHLFPLFICLAISIYLSYINCFSLSFLILVSFETTTTTPAKITFFNETRRS